MATCAVCGAAVSGTQAMDCPECQESYCREHFHGHDCDPVEPTDNATDAGTDGGVSISDGLVRRGAYLIAIPSGILGAVCALCEPISGIACVVSVPVGCRRFTSAANHSRSA